MTLQQILTHSQKFRRNRLLRARLSGPFSHARSKWLFADGASQSSSLPGLLLLGNMVEDGGVRNGGGAAFRLKHDVGGGDGAQDALLSGNLQGFPHH